MNDCQHRLTAETGILEARGTITVPAGDAGALLDPVIVSLAAVVQGDTPLARISPKDYLSIRSGGDGPVPVCYAVVGRTLYLTPTPSVDTILSLLYAARSGEFNSSTNLEVTGEYARVTERLVGAYTLLDDGQPELAARALADYQADVQRLRLRARRRGVSLGSRMIRLRGANPRG